MNKALLFFYCLFISASAFATHNLGGAIYYKYLGNNQYEITAYNYQDVTQVSQYLTLDVSGASVSFLTLTYAGSTEINIACNIPLYTYKFVGILSLPPQQSSDVVLSYGTCCRLPNMTNLNSTPGMLIKL